MFERNNSYVCSQGQVDFIRVHDKKCRYHDICPHYYEDSYSCERDKEAEHYCGSFAAWSRSKSKKIPYDLEVLAALN